MTSIHIIHIARVPSDCSCLYPYTGVRGIHQCATQWAHQPAIVTDDGNVYFTDTAIPVTTPICGFAHNSNTYGFNMKGFMIQLSVYGCEKPLCQIECPWSTSAYSQFYVNVISRDVDYLIIDIANYALFATVVVRFCTKVGCSRVRYFVQK